MVSVALGLNLFRIVDTYAVNLIFWDQFDFMGPFFIGSHPWTMFAWQHGPVRMGLGELVTWVVVQLSGWNTRAESFATLGILFISLPLAVLLKHRLVGHLQVTDVVLPLAFLNQYQYEQMTVTPMIAHSVLPLLLIVVYALAWLIQDGARRLIVVLLVNFVLVFTGFGLFVGLITTAIYLFEYAWASRVARSTERKYAAVGATAALVSLLVFAQGYQFRPGVGCFGFQMSYITAYPLFAAMMTARFLGFNLANASLAGSVLAGSVVLVAFLAAFAWNARCYVRDPLNPDPTRKIAAILTGYSLLFVASAAIGRICLGLGAAQASRYVTLLIPGFLGLLLSASVIKRRRLSGALCCILALMLVGTALPLNGQDRATMEVMQRAKTQWKACYLQTAQYFGCNARTGFTIYPAGPDPWAALHPELARYGRPPLRIVDDLYFLKERNWNLFQEAR